MSRRRARELAFQILFQADVAGVPIEEALRISLQELGGKDAPAATYATELVQGVWKNRKALDRLLNSCSAHWTVERMAPVERNVLRMAAYEILFEEDIPSAVAINEAVELARKYGSEDSRRFVNGILRAVYQKKVDSQEEIKKD